MSTEKELPKVPDHFDFKDVDALQRYLTPQYRIHSAKRTGLPARKQRQLKKAIKYARFLALLPFTS
ncbi:MAG: 30S ribosomal protein S18 [Planctomycetota bacterium]|nr:MAG: 30S ribosomal protein S18 [Planctomycetota bacterium]